MNHHHHHDARLGDYSTILTQTGRTTQPEPNTHIPWRDRPWASQIPDTEGEPHTVAFVRAVRRNPDDAEHPFDVSTAEGWIWIPAVLSKEPPRAGETLYVWGGWNEYLTVAVGDTLYRLLTKAEHARETLAWVLDNARKLRESESTRWAEHTARFEIHPDRHAAYAEWCKISREAPENGEVHRFAERWGSLLDTKIAARKGHYTPYEVISRYARVLRDQADTGKISGTIGYFARKMLCETWIHGDDFRRWCAVEHYYFNDEPAGGATEGA